MSPAQNSNLGGFLPRWSSIVKENRRVDSSPPDLLKLDMGLVRNIHAEPNKQAVVSGIITMMRQLGGRIVAEGVETPEEYFWLRSQGIALYQGYLFAKPGFECLPEPVFPD